MKKIVFINQATGYLTIDIVNAFAGHFDRVALLTGSVRVQDIELHEKVKQVKIARYNRGKPLVKFLSWIRATIQVFFLLLFRFRSYEVFYTTIPPTAYLLSLFLRNRFSVLVYDLYPESLKIANIKESSWIFRAWGRWNRKLFKKAHRIYTLGEGMKHSLSQYVDAEKIQVINNWSGLTDMKPVLREENPFAREHNLEGKFVVCYSGNIGYTHNVETLLEVAELMREDEDIFFLIIGRGERYQFIDAEISRQKLGNCLILPFQPDSEIPNSLSAADLSVVILDEKVATYSIPSKTYNLLAVGSAFMVIGSPEAELAHFVEELKIGSSFTRTQVDEMTSYIRNLKDNPKELIQLKNNALTNSGNFTYLNARKYYDIYCNPLESSV